jgi:hypothetical protein
MTADLEGSGAVHGMPSVADELRGGTSAITNGWLGPGWRVFDASPLRSACPSQSRGLKTVELVPPGKPVRLASVVFFR